LLKGIQKRRQEGTTIFDPIPDTRSAKARLWSLLASILLNTVALGAVALAFEIHSIHSLAARVQHVLRYRLDNSRMVLFLPLQQKPTLRKPALEEPVRTRKAAQAKLPAERDTRILDRLDPRLTEFIKDNPGLDSILTREIVRDIDTRVLTVDTLLKKNSLRVSFEVGAGGNIVNRMLEKSSGVPSIDHLALEVISLLEKLRFLAPMKALKRVTASIEIDEDVGIRFEGEASDELSAEETRKQLQNMLGLIRFVLGKNEAAFILDDVSLLAVDKRIEVSKAFEKQPLIEFLLQNPGSPPKSQ
jgi:hypothetical protein